MNHYFKLLLISSYIIFTSSYGTTQNLDFPDNTEIHNLPDDLNTITSENLNPIVNMLDDAKIIGVTECVHGMVEPFQFRNTLIKELVVQGEIKVVAIESGFPESRLIYDYVLGKDLDEESLFLNGFTYSFGTINPNQELIRWLRDYNKEKESSEKVHFYGFDIPGSPNNPVMENAMAGFNYVFNYLDIVDSETSESFRNSVNEYEVYLRIRDNSQDTLPHFWDLDSTGWDKLESILDDIEKVFRSNSDRYIEKSTMLDYKWAFRSIQNARENVIFLRHFGKSDIDFDSRDYGQFKNIQWIIENESDRRILLFAHSTHLMKEVHGDDPTFLPYRRCGEYLAETYGKDYMTIGNFFRKLEWFDGEPLELQEGYLGYELSKFGTKNYYLDINSLHQKWRKEWCIRITNSGNKLFTDLEKGVDIIYFNDTQTTLFPPENK